MILAISNTNQKNTPRRQYLPFPNVIIFLKIYFTIYEFDGRKFIVTRALLGWKRIYLGDVWSPVMILETRNTNWNPTSTRQYSYMFQINRKPFNFSKFSSISWNFLLQIEMKRWLKWSKPTSRQPSSSETTLLQTMTLFSRRLLNWT